MPPSRSKVSVSARPVMRPAPVRRPIVGRPMTLNRGPYRSYVNPARRVINVGRPRRISTMQYRRPGTSYSVGGAYRQPNRPTLQQSLASQPEDAFWSGVQHLFPPDAFSTDDFTHPQDILSQAASSIDAYAQEAVDAYAQDHPWLGGLAQQALQTAEDQARQKGYLPSRPRSSSVPPPKKRKGKKKRSYVSRR